MTTEIRQFAPGVLRNDKGWILFPTSDQKWRRELFPEAVFDHPAKANLYLIDALVEYLTIPGQSILDPFGGTGTLLIAARKGRRVVLIDVEEQFVELQKQALESWRQAGVGLADTFIYHGDNRQILQQIQYQCDASIFSPPYSNIIGSSGFVEKADSDKAYSKTMAKSYGDNQAEKYAGKQASALNMGRLNPFYFTQAMDTLYQRLAARLVPGAPVAVITKDFMQGEKRVFISEPTIQRCQRNGLKLEEWRKWRPHGSGMQSIAKSKGYNVVEEEDCLIFRKTQ